MAVKYDLYENGIKIATDINSGYQCDRLGDETVCNYHVESYNSVGDDADSNINSGWAADEKLLSITWDTMSAKSHVTTSGSMEYTNNGGSTWAIIHGYWQDLNPGPGPYELRETAALGPVTKCTLRQGTFSNQLTMEGGTNLTTGVEMFASCKELIHLDVSLSDTSNVTDMSNMFTVGNELTTLDLTSFDTSQVTNMYNMFFACRKLTSLDVTSFDTSNVTDMNHMCSSLNVITSLDLTSFNTSNVTDMNHMCSYLHVLTSLDVTSFDTSNVTDMNHMFHACSELTSLDITSFNTSNVTDMNNMFSYNKVLMFQDLTSFDTSNVTDMNRMFYQCYDLKCLTNIDTTNVTNKDTMLDNTGLIQPDAAARADITDANGANWVNPGSCP